MSLILFSCFNQSDKILDVYGYYDYVNIVSGETLISQTLKLNEDNTFLVFGIRKNDSTSSQSESYWEPYHYFMTKGEWHFIDSKTVVLNSYEWEIFRKTFVIDRGDMEYLNDIKYTTHEVIVSLKNYKLNIVETDSIVEDIEKGIILKKRF